MRKLAAKPVSVLLVLVLFYFNAYSNYPDSIKAYRAYTHNNLPDISDGLSLSLTAVDPTCESNNGSITATASNGAPPYQYSLNGEAYITRNYWLYQAPGTYTVTVKDANGNVASSNITLTNHFERPQPAFSPLTPTSGCSSTDATFTVNVTGGTAPYMYSMDLINFQSSNVFTDLAEGWFLVGYAKDANGCLASVNSVEMPGGKYCLSLGYETGGSKCGEGGKIDLEVLSGGKPPYIFSTDGINFQKSGKFNNLKPGVNKIYIKDADDVLFIFMVQIFDSCPLNLTVTQVNATCGKNNGSIQAIASSGTEPYQYSVDGVNFQTNGLFSNLAPGNYTVSVKDAVGIITSKKIIIASGCLTAAATVKNATCSNNNGIITITVSDGTKPYDYSIDGINFQDSDTFSNLDAGNYSLTARDATGITANATASIADMPGPQIKAITTNADCDSDNGTVTITPAGGTPPFQYSLDNINFQTDSIFTNLSPGTFKAYVIDNNTCNSSTGPFTIHNICLNFTAEVTNASCNTSLGAIAVTVTSGNGPYLYSLDGVNFQTGNIFQQLTAGSYTVTVKDNLGTIKTREMQVHKSCIAIKAGVTNTTCEKNNGTILMKASNGVEPYTYSLDGNDFYTDSLFTGLPSGKYKITVKDAANTVTDTTVYITVIPAPEIVAVATPSGCDNNDGSVTISATGGRGPYLYSLNGNSYTSTNVYNRLPVNTYTSKVKDADGCLSAIQIKVPLKDNLFVNTQGDTAICEGSNIQMAVNSNGKKFSWFPVAGLDNVNIATPKAFPSVTTKYIITASTDICSATDSVVIVVNPAPVADAGKDTSICYGKSIALNGAGGLQYSWTPSQYLSDARSSTPLVIKPGQTITYHLQVADNKGCTSLNDATVTVKVTPVAKVFAGNDSNAVLNQPIQLVAKDINNSGFTSYNWTPATGLSNSFIANPEAILNRNTTYTVTASTASGCEATDVVNIKVYAGPDIYVPSAFTPDNNGLNDVLKAIPVGIKDFLFFKVFDRWGKMVFNTTDYNIGWKGGRLNEFNPSLNTYVWMAGGKDKSGKLIFRKGTVTLIR